MALIDDTTIYPYSKVIRHTDGTTVYGAIAFYSFLQDQFDEPGFLSYESAIDFNTPTSFTMTNGWHLDNGDGSNILQYIEGGSINTVGYATVSDPVYMLDLTGTTDFVASDLDKTVTDDAGDVGPLLSYLNDYPVAGSARIWVRDTNSNGTIATSSAIAVTSGTGAGTANGASLNGDEIYANLFSLADFPGSPNPQVYVYQNHPQSGDRVRIAEWSAFSNWDRGSIDILIPVQLGGVLIDGGNVTTFVHQTGDTFTFVESDLSSGARTPIALETAADEVNVTKGEHYLLYDGSDTGSFTDGDVISDVDLSAGVPPTWYAEVVSVEEFADTTTGLLVLRGYRGAILDNDNIYVNNVIEGVANGTPGDTVISYSAGTDPTTLGQVMTGGTSTATRLLRGVDATENRLVCQDDPTVTGTSRNTYYIDYSNGETVTGGTDGSVTTDAVSTTLISGYNDITVAHMNGTVTVSSVVGTFLAGERITWNAGASSAIFIALSGGTTMMLGNVDSTDEPDAADSFVGDVSAATADCDSGLTDDNTENFEFPLQSTGSLYSVLIQGGDLYNAGRSLADIYSYLQFYVRDGQGIAERIIYTSDGTSITELAAEEYIKADASYAATKPAPFGTLAGGVFFGAQAVWIEGMDSSDLNNVKLIDSTGALQEPFTSISATVSNTRADDRIELFPKEASEDKPLKTQYTSHNTNNVVGDITFERDATTFPNDTPASGTFTVVDSSANEEHRYRFDSYSGTVLTLGTGVSGTADSTVDDFTLTDTGIFIAANTKVGDIIRRTNGAGGWAYVVSRDSDNQVTTTKLSAGTGWASGDTFETNALVVTYDNTDTFFIPYLSAIEDTGTDGSPGSETQSLTYVEDRDVLLVVRNVEAATQIKPFKTAGVMTLTGYSQAVIRTEDTVFA